MSSDRGTTVGVTGQRWRATVSPWGSVTPWGADQTTLEWFVAADDRWHVPANEAAVRQRRIGGAPITETRVRIPDGDVVQRVWSVADRGGLTIIEIENDSPLPFAVAFSGAEVFTERVPVDVPIRGIELPASVFTLPVAHHTSIRVAIAHGPVPAAVDRNAVSLSSLPGSDSVTRGWVSLAERASRLELPDDGLSAAVIEARCDVMLEGPVDPETDPIGFVLDVGELIRCGDDAEPWLPEIVGPIESVARSGDPRLSDALDAGERIAHAAGDRRAAGDIRRLAERATSSIGALELGPFSELRRTGSVGRFVNDVERRLANGADLLPAGIPTAWLGADFELHDVPTSATSAVSLAVRWHGERPAVLWEQTGVPRRLTASAVDRAWSTTEVTGEALWAPPRRAVSTTKLTLSHESVLPAVVDPGDDGSRTSSSFT